MKLNRWAAVPTADGWRVTSETGKRAPSPHSFRDYKKALRRADMLNHDEQYQVIEAKKEKA